MAKLSRNAEKNNRKLTDFFVRTSSQIPSSPLSHPPSSSQPGPSSSQPRSSQQSTGRSAPLTTSKPHIKVEKKLKAPPVSDKEVISLSSDSGPIVISSDTSKSHISISSGSASKSVLALSGSDSPEELKHRATNSKSTMPVSTRSKRRQLPHSIAVKTEPSTAKTTVKKRATSTAVPSLPPRLNLTRDSRPIKRKCTWDASGSSSEESDDGRIFVPRPGGMNASLTQAPVPRLLAKPDPSSSPIADLLPSSPLKSLRSVHSNTSRSSKRLRVDTTEPSTAVSGNDADDEELVPSSQSDEQELTLPKKLSKDPAKVKNTVDKWRRESSVALSPPAAKRSSFPLDDLPVTPPASSPAEANWTSNPASPGSPLPLPLPQDADGDVHMDSIDLQGNAGPSDPITHVPEGISLAVSRRQFEDQLASTSSATGPTSDPRTPPPRRTTPSLFDEPTIGDFRPLTPPPSDEPLKPRVAALSVEEKTAMIIEKLKADAAAQAAEAKGSSDEEAPSFHELDSDSSDEELLFNFGTKGKGTAIAAQATGPSPKAPSSRASSSKDVPPATQRYSLRRRSSPGPSTIRQNSPVAVQPKGPARKTANPLDKLLREKKTAEKKGGGMEGLMAAEAVLASANAKKDKGKGKMKAEMDEEESSDDEWGNEEAAMRVVAQTSQRIGFMGRSSGGASAEDDEDEDGEGEQFAMHAATKLLDGDEGKKEAVHRILERDRKSWLGKKKARKVVRGVQLWDDTIAPLVAGGQSIPELTVDEGFLARSGALRFLMSVIASNDESKLSRCLLPQLFSTLAHEDLPLMIPWLTSVVLSSSNELLTQRAMAVIEFIARKCISTTLELSPLIASCLRALGAKEDCLAYSTQAVPVHVRHSPLLLRGFAVSKLVRIVDAFVRQDAVAIEDIPDLIVTLLLVALDPSTSPSLRTEIAVLIDSLSARIPSNSAGVSDMEPALCSRLSRLTSGWSTMNKAFMLSILRGGSPQLGRMSRWLGYCTLLNSEVPAKGEYFTLPKLHPIIKLLTPSPSTQPASAFDVMKNADKDDFCSELSDHIDILEVVLCDVESYVQEERALPSSLKTTNTSSPGSRIGSPEKDRPQSELEMIVGLLEKMHGKINDARAGDLDRSKVKASLQYCWSRIHYQRGVALKAGLAGRPKNLKGYFPRPIPRLNTQASMASTSN